MTFDLVRQAADVVGRTFGDETILYKRQGRRLYRLNMTATLLWKFFEASPFRSRQEILDLAELASQTATVIETVAYWLQEGLLVEHRGETIVSRFAVGPLCIQIESDAVIAADLAIVHGGFPAWDTEVDYLACSIAVEDEKYKLVVGAEEQIRSAEEIVPAFKAELTTALLASNFNVALHCATLVRNGRALLLCGAPGAGKTTLALGLAASTFELHGDDISLVDGQGRVSGMAFPAVVKSKSWELLSTRYANLATSKTHTRPDLQQVKYLPVGAGASHYVPVSDVLFLERASVPSPRRETIDPAEAFLMLISEAAGPRDVLSVAGFESLSRLVQCARAGRLIYQDLTEAVAFIDSDF